MASEILFSAYGRSDFSNNVNLITNVIKTIGATELIYYAAYRNNRNNPSEPDVIYYDFSPHNFDILTEIPENEYDFIDACVQVDLIQIVDNYFSANMGLHDKGDFEIDKLLIRFGPHITLLYDDNDDVCGMEESNLSFDFSGKGTPSHTQKFRDICRRAATDPDIKRIFSNLLYSFKTQPICCF